MAAQSRGSVNVLVQPEKDSFDAIATLLFSSRSVRTWKSSSAPCAVEFHVAELVDAEQIDAAVAGDGLGELFLVGGFDEFVDQFRGQDVADPVAGVRGGGAQGDEQMAFAGAGVADQAERLAGADPGAGGEGVDGGGVDGGVRGEVEVGEASWLGGSRRL